MNYYIRKRTSIEKEVLFLYEKFLKFTIFNFIILKNKPINVNLTIITIKKEESTCCFQPIKKTNLCTKY